MKTMKLVDFMAKACSYAQEHIDDSVCWRIDKKTREVRLQCTSFQVACFLAQNTVDGKKGVEFDVVLPELAEHPMKSEADWKVILNARAKEFGGWKR